MEIILFWNPRLKNSAFFWQAWKIKPRERPVWHYKYQNVNQRFSVVWKALMLSFSLSETRTDLRRDSYCSVSRRKFFQVFNSVDVHLPNLIEIKLFPPPAYVHNTSLVTMNDPLSVWPDTAKQPCSPIMYVISSGYFWRLEYSRVDKITATGNNTARRAPDGAAREATRSDFSEVFPERSASFPQSQPRWWIQLER